MAHLRAQPAGEQSFNLLAVSVSCLRVKRRPRLLLLYLKASARYVLQSDECFLLQCENVKGGRGGGNPSPSEPKIPCWCKCGSVVQRTHIYTGKKCTRAGTAARKLQGKMHPAPRVQSDQTKKRKEVLQ